MQFRKWFCSLLIGLLLTLAVLPAAYAELPDPAELPEEGDYVLRIDGGQVAEHLETVNGKEALRVDLYLDGVTSSRKLSSISFKLLYDPEQLTFEKSKALWENGVMSVDNPNVPGVFQFAFASSFGIVVSETTPLLTLWFTVADGLADGTQIRFAFSEAIKAGSYDSQKRSVGVKLSPFTVGTTRYGDANCDGSVTAADAAFALRALAGLETISEQGLKNAKVDGTDVLNAEDAALILRFVVKLIERFPVQE